MRKFYLISLFLLFSLSKGYSLNFTPLNYLRDIRTNSYPGGIEVSLGFDQELDFKKGSLEYLEDQIVQIDLPGTGLYPPKRSLSLKNKILRKIEAFPLGKEGIRIHLVLAQKKANLNNLVYLEIQNKRANIFIQEKDSLPASSLVTFSGKQDLREKREETEGERKGEEGEVKLPLVAEKPFKANPGGEVATKITKVNKAEVLPTPNLFLSSLKMTGSLALILSAVFFIYHLMKRFLVKKGIIGGKENLIRVLATNYLGDKKIISLVEIGGEVLVLGITNNNISLLTKLEKEEQLEKIKKQIKSKDASSLSFSKELERADLDPPFQSKRDYLKGFSLSLQEKLKDLKRF